MTCESCGQPCQGRQCRECERLEYHETWEAPADPRYECGRCHREEALEEGMLCLECRREQMDDGGDER